MAVISSMGHGGDHQAMPRIKGALLVLLLVLAATGVTSSARSSALPKRNLLGSIDKPRTIALDLMHVRHFDSPYMPPNLTLTERVQISVANSRRRLGTAPVFTSPLDATQAEYIMQINVGTPARTFAAVADTGSDLVWLQCSSCTTCLPIPDSPFDPSASSSYVNVLCGAAPCNEVRGFCSSNNLCQYIYNYGDGSFTNGDIAYETFTVISTDGSLTPIPSVAFGCGTDDGSTSALLQRADGLVGLGKGPLSLVSQLQPYICPIFSYCLTDYYASQSSSILFGSAGANEKTYTPIIPNAVYSSFYYVNLLGITVNGQQIDIPPGTFTVDSSGSGGIILDSGTTFSALVDAAYVPFENAIAAVISYPQAGPSFLSLCYDTSGESTLVFPTVVFQFENVDITLADGNTFLAVDNQGTYCLAFQSFGTNPYSIYGNVQQSNFEIAYDIGNQQIGFTQSIAC